MKLAGLCTVLLFLSFCVQGQNIGRVTGSIYSDSSKVPVEGASVTLQNLRDSSVERIALSGKKGTFNFTDLKFGDYQLQVTVLNHLPYERAVKLDEAHKVVAFDSVKLTFVPDSLASVTVTSIRTPVKIFGDTTEFNAASFKTRDNAMAEDLLRKLPGIEVMRDGSIKANGEKVTQILVDGQPFFSGDPTMATQNLPKDIIDKIQLIDEKSEKGRMTNVEDGIRNKVINIVIKKDKKKGAFGRAYAGAGTNDTYETKLSANYFSGSRKLSLVAGGNNTGRNDYGGDNDSRSNASYNNYNGFTKDAQLKLNFNDKWGKSTNVNVSVGYSKNRNLSLQTRNRQNIFGDSSTWYQESSSSLRERSGVNSGFGFEYRPDTLLHIRMNGSVNFGKNIFQTSSAFNSTLPENKKLNDGNRDNRGESSSPSYNANMSVSKRFKGTRRVIFLNVSNNANTNLSDNFNISNNFYYPVNVPAYQRLINQLASNNGRNSSINTSINYNEPIGKKGSLSMNVGQNISVNNAERELFDYNLQSGLYDQLNDTLSSNFRTTNSNTTFGANYSYSFGKGTFSLGTSWQNAISNSKSLTSDSMYRQKSRNFTPQLSFNRFSKGKSFNMFYSFSTIAPQASQLQPVLDNSNPLYLRLGNPNLRFSSTHRMNGSLNIYSSKSNNSVYLNGNFSLIDNAFSSSTIYDKTTGGQITQPINVKGVYSAGGNLSYNRQLKLFKQTIRWNNNVNFNLNRGVSLIDLEKNTNSSTFSGISTGFDVDVSDWLDMGISYNVNIQTTRYSLRPNMNNSSYTNSASVRGEIRPLKLTELRFDWNFSNNTGRSAGFNRQVNMVNADLTQYFNARKNYWLMFKVYDLLKQNIGIYRTSGANYIEDAQTNVLTRFFLVSANMRLSKFGGRKK